MGFYSLTFVFAFLPYLIAAQKCQVTMNAIEGPYYKPNAPTRADQSVCEYQKVKNGTQLLVQGRIFNSDCSKSVEALVDVWTADPQGVYSPHSKDSPDFLCRGKVKSDANGNYKFLTVIPGHYKAGSGFRPAHIHFKIFSLPEKNPSKENLMTQLYFVGDPDIPNDVCDVKYCHAGDPTLTFPLVPQPDKSYLVRFDVVLGQQRPHFEEADSYTYVH